MAPANKPPAATRKRNRKRKRRVASSSSSSSSSDSDSDSSADQATVRVTKQPPIQAQPQVESSSDDTTSSESDSDSDDSSPPSLKQQAVTKPIIPPPRARSHSPTPPPPAPVPSFLPPPDDATEQEQALRSKFRKFWMASVADAFKSDLEEIRKEPGMTTSRLAILIDSLASGADVFTSSSHSAVDEDVNEMEVVLETHTSE